MSNKKESESLFPDSLNSNNPRRKLMPVRLEIIFLCGITFFYCPLQREHFKYLADLTIQTWQDKIEKPSRIEKGYFHYALWDICSFPAFLYINFPSNGMNQRSKPIFPAFIPATRINIPSKTIWGFILVVPENI